MKKLLLLAICAIYSTTSMAEPKEHKHKKNKEHKYEHQERQHNVSKGNTYVNFSDKDRVYIERYYTSHPEAAKLPPGLAKQGKVPPGWAKKLNKGDVIEVRAYERLPRDLEMHLPRLPDDRIRIRLGGDIAVIDVRTQTVIDVINGILK